LLFSLAKEDISILHKQDIIILLRHSSIKKEDYPQVMESLDQVQKLVGIIETGTPSREVEDILSQAEGLIKKGEVSQASAGLKTAETALKKLVWYKSTVVVRNLIRKANRYLRQNKLSEALAKIELAKGSVRIYTLQRRIDEIKENGQFTREYIGQGKKKEALESMEKLLTPLMRLQYLLPLTDARGYLGEAQEVISRRGFDKGLALVQSAESKIALAFKSAEQTEQGYVIRIQNELKGVKKSLQMKEPRSVALVYGVWMDLQKLVLPKACK